MATPATPKAAGKKAATAAGAGSPGTNTTKPAEATVAGAPPATGQAPQGATAPAVPQPPEGGANTEGAKENAPVVEGATEARQEEAAVIAEALTPAGGSVGEVIADAVEERPNGAEPGEKVGGQLKALIVRALPEAGFRRAGRHWPAEAVEVPADELSAEQIDALLREPMLHVTLIGEPDGE